MQIKTQRVSVLVSVPKTARRAARPRVAALPGSGDARIPRRCTVASAGGDIATCIARSDGSSGAPSSARRRSIRSWRSTGARLGFLVIQGYGLTETAPIVTLNHPFSAQKGIGRQADSRRRGEDRGGRRDPRARGERHDRLLRRSRMRRREAFEDGWLHTGDIGGVDDAGRVFIRGRKKEMIVTPEGLNVFPEDVERALNAIAGRARVGGGRPGLEGEERVHAVLVVDAWRGRGRGRARREREARRSSEDPQPRGLAVGDAAADGRHAQAETARDQGLGGCGRQRRTR